ncbi:hypothetical protein WA026_006078 [Henosepilachna vigintioctopunctata]|uniref:Uncharacterized protein n=1 Tax=Henosepilachna vigintioctopunctata TaxID=420089 RepID=A0AAW1THU4_9CUCU
MSGAILWHHMLIQRRTTSLFYNELYILTIVWQGRTINEQLRLTWENYIKDLYQNVRPATRNLTQQEDINGPPILVSEVEYAVANLKDGKAPGEDMIHAEVLELMDPKILRGLFNKIYDSGIIPTG